MPSKRVSSSVQCAPHTARQKAVKVNMGGRKHLFYPESASRAGKGGAVRLTGHYLHPKRGYLKTSRFVTTKAASKLGFQAA